MTLTKQDDILNLVGVIGGSAISLSLLPQVFLTYKTKCTTDISYLYQAIYIFGTALVNTYAIYFGYWAVYVPCLLEMFFIITLTVMKVIYDQRNKKLLSQQSHRRSSLLQSFKSDAMKGANVRTCHLNLDSVHRKTYDLRASLGSNSVFPISTVEGTSHSLDPLSYLKKSLRHFHKVEIDAKDAETMESISKLASNEIEVFLKNIAAEKDKRNDDDDKEECVEEKQYNC
ncbi:hypothetical protein CTEN210_11627 [Chaetoceros tenuissimus]|uniref:Uncharacterized protein n=1 Tax=Chaetoceros tenuissimus TaxID=426638 RepID=A0AAD3CZQ9_9STRA|nr:hypothetical protein CTEN210_11627 [Chaetoceros tenuissimus]